MDATGLQAQERGPDEHLQTQELLIASGDHLPIRLILGLIITLLQGVAGRSCGHFLLKIQGNPTELFLNVIYDLFVSTRGKTVTWLCQHDIVCQDPDSQVQAQDGMWKCVSLVYKHCMCESISTVHASGARRSIQS